MRAIGVALAACAAVAMAGTAQAQSLSAAQLVGKTCVGTFDSGRGSDQSRGGFAVKFEMRSNQLVVTWIGALGSWSYNKASEGRTQLVSGGTNNAALADYNFGPSVTVPAEVTGQQVRFLNPGKGNITLVYNGAGAFSGTADPRVSPDRMGMSPGQIDARCTK
jgi:hypothetical protein